MAEHSTDEEKSEIPSPRFDVIASLFDDIDDILANKDEKVHLTLFEFEILILMLRKKIDHMGIMASLQPEEHTHDHEGSDGPTPYK